jgi:hypothetical protein
MQWTQSETRRVIAAILVRHKIYKYVITQRIFYLHVHQAVVKLFYLSNL